MPDVPPYRPVLAGQTAHACEVSLASPDRASRAEGLNPLELLIYARHKVEDFAELGGWEIEYPGDV